MQIQQVVLNLVRNSLDALEKSSGETCLIRATSRRHTAEQAVIMIADTGPGLESTELQSMFKAFYTTKNTGMGMGLPISRSIIESHGGQLWAESSPRGGASFYFTVPFDLPTAKNHD